MVVTYPEVRRGGADRESSNVPADQRGELNTGGKLTVGELQHLVDDAGLVLGDPHVLQDLDHHLWPKRGQTKVL